MSKIDILRGLAEVIVDICDEAEQTLNQDEVEAFYNAFIESVDTTEIDCLGSWGTKTLFQYIGVDKYGY